MSSLFLNSPFTNVTFPCSSNSVQRKRGSFDAFVGSLGDDPSRKLASGGGFLSRERSLFNQPHQVFIVAVENVRREVEEPAARVFNLASLVESFTPRRPILIALLGIAGRDPLAEKEWNREIFERL